MLYTVFCDLLSVDLIMTCVLENKETLSSSFKIQKSSRNIKKSLTSPSCAKKQITKGIPRKSHYFYFHNKF